MLSLGPQQRYYLYAGAADMRKGFDGLSGLVRSAMANDPVSGDVFIFVNRRRDRMKLLVWDRSGFVLWYKRLESGTFELPKPVAGGWTSDTYRLCWDIIAVRRQKFIHI